MKDKKKRKSLVGWIRPDWIKEFGFTKGCRDALVPNILHETPKNKFYFDQFHRVKVRITIEELR